MIDDLNIKAIVEKRVTFHSLENYQYKIHDMRLLGFEVSKFLKLWKEERVFFYPLIWLTCGLFVILRGSGSHILRIEWLDIDIIPVFLIYLITNDQNHKASFLAFFMGILTDVFAPCQIGVFAFAYSAILLGVNPCQRFLDLNNIKTSMLLVALFLVVKWSFLLIIMKFFPIRQTINLIPFILVAFSIIITSLTTPFLFYLLNVIKRNESQD